MFEPENSDHSLGAAYSDLWNWFYKRTGEEYCTALSEDPARIARLLRGEEE